VQPADRDLQVDEAKESL